VEVVIVSEEPLFSNTKRQVRSQNSKFTGWLVESLLDILIEIVCVTEHVEMRLLLDCQIEILIKEILERPEDLFVKRKWLSWVENKFLVFELSVFEEFFEFSDILRLNGEVIGEAMKLGNWLFYALAVFMATRLESIAVNNVLVEAEGRKEQF
jgi:hypothetical protein